MTTKTNGLFLITRPLLFVERRRSVPARITCYMSSLALRRGEHIPQMSDFY